uniref:Uncharacterized protein n=1 Tax=Chromera velia CCMP2878 TaxID=1169474 RepID=A0A0G4GRL0_9ALVE|eukprot:Cvel_23083.t1-p1 / transcript=Cvel_23083.t1 / gene=Cvel_23083 / organism=Chromera_velia_CCMP2878 / gene_product=hypothetical protein / transcript_product=hypothetical protein / location=Cvel_scaffold2338:10095-18135(+) / protein_length=905 / sequence_SO=supercontig / SO=protein_coding / is_pseudo=false
MADLPLLHGGMDGEDDLIYYPPGQSGDFETEEAFAFPGASNLHSQFKDKLADQMQDPDDAEFQSPNDSPSLPLLKRGAPEKPYERDREDLTTTTRPSPSVGLQNDPLSPFDYSTQNTPAMHMPEDEEDKLHQMLPQPRKPQPTTFPQRSSGSQISESQERDTPSLSGANVQPAPSAVFPSQQRKSSTSSSIKAKEETIKEEEPPKQTAPQRRLVAPPRDENSVLAKNRDRTNVPAPTAIAQKTADREERRHSGSSQGKARAEQEDIHQGKEKETLRRRSSDLKPQVSAATAPSKPAPKRAPSKTEAASPSSPVRRATKTNSEKREEPPSPLAVSQRLFAAAQNRESKRKSKELSPERTQQQTLIEGPRRTTEDAKKISERLYNRAAANKERRQRQEESLQAERDRARQAGTGLSRGKSSAEVAATFEKLYKASVEKQRRVEEAQRRASEHEVAMLEALRRKGTTGDPAVDAERVKAAVERMHAEGRIRREKIEKRAAEQAAAQVEGLGSLHRKARESVDSASHGQLFEDLYADAKRRRQTQERRHKEVEEAQVETLHRIGVHWKEWVRKKVRESKVETGGAEKGTAGEQRKSSTEEADLEKEGEEEKDLNLSSEAQVEKSSEKKGPSASSSSSSSSPNQPTLPLSQPQPSASAAVAASSVHNHLFALAEEKRQKQEDRQRAKAEAEAMQLREVSVHREAQRGRDGTRFQKLYEDAEWRRFKLEERAAAKEAETERMLQEASVHRRLLTELQARVLRAEEEGESPTAILKEMRWDREERAEERKLAVIEEIRRAHRTGSSTLQFSHIILPDQRRPQQGRASIGTLDDSGGSLSSTGLVQEGDMDAHSVPLRENSKTLVQMSDDSENEEAEDEDEEEEDVQIVVTSGRTGGPGAAGDGTGPASPSWR